jgi:gamma-glutamyltranspeptidase/glutathione hydrolase
MADDRFIEAPTKELIAPAYLDARAKLIDLSKGAAAIPVGDAEGRGAAQQVGERGDAGAWHDAPVRGGRLWQCGVADGDDRVRVRLAPDGGGYGFWLNNQLTDFSLVPEIDGKPVANAVAPRKAPRSSMSPSIITDRTGELVLVAGSMGGSTIIASVSRTIIGVLDWKQTPQEAVGTSAVFARTPEILVEKATA